MKKFFCHLLISHHVQDASVFLFECKVLGHLVERRCKLANFIGSVHRHAHLKISSLDFPRPRNHLSQRCRKAMR